MGITNFFILTKIQEHVIKKSGSLNAPLSVALEITNKCNQNCVFCYQSVPFKTPKKKHYLSLDTLEVLCRQFEEIGVAAVSLTGGEPTCHPEFLPAIALIRRYNLALGIETNGTNLTEAEVQQLGTILQWERDKFVLSFDAVDKDTYQRLRGSSNFDSFITTLKYFKRYQIPFVTNTVVLKENLDQIEAILELALKNGALECRVGPPYLMKQIPVETYATLDEILRVYEKLASFRDDGQSVVVSPVRVFMDYGYLPKDNSSLDGIKRGLTPCYAGYDSCGIDINGNVGICLFTLDLGLSAGNVYKKDFPELWRNVLELRSELERRTENKTKSLCPVGAFKGL